MKDSTVKRVAIGEGIGNITVHCPTCSAPVVIDLTKPRRPIGLSDDSVWEEPWIVACDSCGARVHAERKADRLSKLSMRRAVPFLIGGPIVMLVGAVFNHPRLTAVVAVVLLGIGLFRLISGVLPLCGNAAWNTLVVWVPDSELDPG